MSDYNPFDLPPPVLDKPAETPPESQSKQPVAPAREARHATPPAPGKAPLAGQPGYGNQTSPQPPPAMPAPSAPTPVGQARYDLAGNPLPAQAASGPSIAPAQQYVGEVRFDLAGNPLPPQSMPAPPPGQFGYSAGNAPYGQPPAPAYGGYQAPTQPSLPPPTIPGGMEEAMTAGANWMIGIVLMTLASIWLNGLVYPFFFPFVSWAAISGVISFTYILVAFMHYTPAAILSSISLLPLGLLAFLGFKRQAWVFVIAMIIYGFDIPVTILTWILHFNIWGIIFGTAWHSFVFQRMFAAWTAAREINATMAGRRL